MTESGVDLGAVTNRQDNARDKDLTGVSKLKATKRVSKFNDNQDGESEQSSEFEAGLKAEAVEAPAAKAEKASKTNSSI
jgi:hypothetical protein